MLSTRDALHDRAERSALGGLVLEDAVEGERVLRTRGAAVRGFLARDRRALVGEPDPDVVAEALGEASWARGPRCRRAHLLLHAAPHLLLREWRDDPHEDFATAAGTAIDLDRHGRAPLTPRS
jgi:hypothetical protein